MRSFASRNAKRDCSVDLGLQVAAQAFLGAQFDTDPHRARVLAERDSVARGDVGVDEQLLEHRPSTFRALGRCGTLERDERIRPKRAGDARDGGPDRLGNL